MDSYYRTSNARIAPNPPSGGRVHFGVQSAAKPKESRGFYSEHVGTEEHNKKGRLSSSSNDNYQFVSQLRGSDFANLNIDSYRLVDRSSRPPSTGSAISSFNSTGTGSTSEGSSSQLRMKRWMTSIYKITTGHDPDEQALDDINRFLYMSPDKRNIGNETRWMEKLKIHLIKQNREKEAKRLVELYQKLKGMSVLTNREALIGLMYSLFDKEATRAILAATHAAKKQIGETGLDMNGERINEGIDRVKLPGNTSVDRRGNLKVNNVFPTSDGFRSYTSVSTASCRETISEHGEYNSMEEIDHTPIPRLHSSSDNLLGQEMATDTKIPALSKSGQPKVDLEKGDRYWDSVSQMDSQSYVGPHSTLQSISKISRPTDETHRNLTGLAGSIPNIFSSTPMENVGAKHRQRQFNLRKLQDSQNISLRPPHSGSFNGSSSGTAHTFGNIKSMERDLIRDIVFILQGIDGTYIKATPKGTFDIATKQFVHPTLRLQTLKLCEMGFCYSQIRNYCDKPVMGLMAQGFKQAIEKELQEYYRLLAVIQGRIQQTIVDTPMSEDVSSKFSDMTMLKLTIWLFECRPRLKILSGMVESCDSKRGGDLCSAIHKYSMHGDPLINNLTVSLLSTICKPLYIMLSQWILYGELEDPFNEFFIAQDPMCRRDQLWHYKYRIRSEMRPSFISTKQAEKILAIGKNINFLKDICHNVEGFEGRYEIKALLETGEVDCLFVGENSPIQYAIEMAYKTTSEKVLKVLIEDSNLLDHLKAIKKYLLLGQGDFIQYFLELIQDELSKPASKLYNHNIAAILESAVRATNAQFENEDVLSRLDTRILPTSGKDVGWDVFCLDYRAHGPIGTVLTEDVMNGYNKLFNSLWRTKRIEIILSTLWKNQTVLFKYLRLIPEIAPVLHRSQLLISEMIHFVHQTQYYIMFEATEVAWEKLMEDVNKSSDLDEVIRSHKKFLETIFKRSLLDSESRDLLNQLRGIFDSVHELKIFLNEFNERIEVEVEQRKNLEPNTDETKDAQREFFAVYVMQAKGKIETLYTTTQDLVRMFLLVLNRQQDLTLQCLSFRLDFNEYYHQKDSRLSQPLTFQHRRLSFNSFAPVNMSTSFSGSLVAVASTSIPEVNEDEIQNLE